jgi:hypothetical protein
MVFRILLALVLGTFMTTAVASAEAKAGWCPKTCKRDASGVCVGP